MAQAAVVWFVGVLMGAALLTMTAASAQETAPPVKSPPEPVSAQVDLSAPGRLLQDVLHNINVAQSPSLEAAEVIRGERLSVYVRHRSIAAFRQDLHVLFNYDWIADTDPPPIHRYTLVLSERQRQYETDLWRQTLERGATRLLELTGYLATSQQDYANLDAQLRQQNKEPDDPLLRDNLFYLSRYGPRLGLRLLTTLTPDQRMNLLENGETVLVPEAMSPEQQELTHGLGLSIGEFRKRYQSAHVGETPEDSAALADRVGIILRVMQHPISGTVIGFDYGLGEGGMASASLGNQPPMPDLLPVRGNPYHFDPNRVNPARKTPLPRYSALERLPFPAEFKLEAGATATWRDVVGELARHVSLPIYSDDYAFSPAPDPRDRQYYFPEPNEPVGVLADAPLLKHQNLEAGLDALCDQYRTLWWYENGALFFRSRTWFIERQYEVPPAVLALLESHLRKAGGKYDAACLTALSTLTLHQLQGLNVTSGARLPQFDRQMETGQARSTYGYLQVISLLDDAQKERVLSPSGLPLAEMTAQQQTAFVQMLFTNRGPEILNRLPNVRLKAEQPGGDTSPHPQAVQAPVVYFTYRDQDAYIAHVRVAYKALGSAGLISGRGR